MVKNPSANAGDIRDVSLIPGLGRSPGMATHSSILAWRTHGQRSLAGWSPWGAKEGDTTDATWHACVCGADSLCCTAETNTTL